MNFKNVTLNGVEFDKLSGFEKDIVLRRIARDYEERRDYRKRNRCRWNR